MRPDSNRPGGRAGSSVVRRRRRASGSNVAPWTSVEVRTTKKTMLKMRSADATSATTGNVASQIGVAPRSPAQPIISRSRMSKRVDRVERTAATGRATRISAADSARPLSATSGSSLGKTSRPRMKKRPICATQLTPWWKATIVRRPGMPPVPSHSAVR